MNRRIFIFGAAATAVAAPLVTVLAEESAPAAGLLTPYPSYHARNQLGQLWMEAAAEDLTLESLEAAIAEFSKTKWTPSYRRPVSLDQYMRICQHSS